MVPPYNTSACTRSSSLKFYCPRKRPSRFQFLSANVEERQIFNALAIKKSLRNDDVNKMKSALCRKLSKFGTFERCGKENKNIIYRDRS
jgi:hypothetical protein